MSFSQHQDQSEMKWSWLWTSFRNVATSCSLQLIFQKRGKTFGPHAVWVRHFSRKLVTSAPKKRVRIWVPFVASPGDIPFECRRSFTPPALEDCCGGWVAESHLVVGGKSLRKKEATSGSSCFCVTGNCFSARKKNRWFLSWWVFFLKIEPVAKNKKW